MADQLDFLNTLIFKDMAYSKKKDDNSSPQYIRIPFGL